MPLEQQYDVPKNIHMQDVVPIGTFFAFAGEYTSRRIAAIRKAISLGRELAIAHPQVADMYADLKSPNRYIDIAKEFIPEIAEANIEFARVVVGYAIRSLNPKAYQAELTAKHRAIQLEKQFEKFGSEKHIEHQRKAAKARHEKAGVNVGAMIKGADRTEWTTEERQIVLDYLIYLPEFQHQKGSIKGTPDYELIANALNELYHHDEPIRYTNSVASMVRDHRRKKGKSKDLNP